MAQPVTITAERRAAKGKGAARKLRAAGRVRLNYRGTDFAFVGAWRGDDRRHHLLPRDRYLQAWNLRLPWISGRIAAATG